MLIQKVYDEEKKIQKAWFDSSNIYFTEMVENPTENKGDLFVTFKNGTTYKYKDVLFEDYVYFLYGGIDMSQGKTLNKNIKPKYDVEKVGNADMTALANELEELIKQQDADAQDEKTSEDSDNVEETTSNIGE